MAFTFLKNNDIHNPYYMDRLREFLAIVEHTEIPQNSINPPSFYLNIKEIENKLNRLFEQLSKLTVYESFIAQSLLSQAKDLLKTYKGIQINENVSRDYLDVVQNLKSMIKTKYLRYTLKMNELTRKYSKAVSKSSPSLDKSDASTTENEPKGNSQNLQLQGMYFQQPEKQALAEEQREDYMEERRRVVSSITEIGQIVEDISIHVNLQEEQLRRIDDVLIKNDKWTKKAMGELNDIWGIVKSKRSGMIKFFVFWVLIILLFRLIRR